MRRFKGALEKDTHDMPALGFSMQIEKLRDQSKTDSSAERLTDVNQLIDMEWKFGGECHKLVIQYHMLTQPRDCVLYTVPDNQLPFPTCAVIHLRGVGEGGSDGLEVSVLSLGSGAGV